MVYWINGLLDRRYIWWVLTAWIAISVPRTSAQTQAVDPTEFIDAIVLVDSEFVSIEKNGREFVTLRPPAEHYFSGAVRYDAANDLISVIQCSTLTRGHWWYKALVWNYRSGQKWVIKEDKTYYGEGYVAPVVFRYWPSEKKAVIQNNGWEWSWVTFLSNGKEERLEGLSHDFVRILALLPENRIVVSAFYHGVEGPPEYYVYSWDSKQLSELTLDGLSTYKEAILRDSGRNVNVLQSPELYEGVPASGRGHWNPQSTAFVFTKHDPRSPLRRKLYMYDPSSQSEKQLAEKHLGYAIIWKTEKQK